MKTGRGVRVPGGRLTMQYRFATERPDYSDYASGKVFHALPGHPAFPIRLTSEIFQRCMAVRTAAGSTGPCVLYDPVCGGAYHLSTLAYLHGADIKETIGSDIDEEALSLAARNLALLTLDGLDRRIAELEAMWVAFGKASHRDALESAGRLRHVLAHLAETHPIQTRLFRADATDAATIRGQLHGKQVDIVISDVPYGRLAAWQTTPASPPLTSPLGQMLEALVPVLSPGAVVAISADKRQKIAHDAYRRLEKFKIGKRQIMLLQLQEQR